MSAIGTKQTSTSYLGEVAMRSIIQAKGRALKLNVLAVCAVFVFVGVVLLGAFWVQEADDNAKSIMPGDGWTIRYWRFRAERILIISRACAAFFEPAN
jgi:hypothetical protein